MVRYTAGCILLSAVALALAYHGSWAYAGAAWLASCALAVRQLYQAKQDQRNVGTVLKAIQNNDYTFSLRPDTTGMSRALNRVKAILQEARQEVRMQEEFLSVIIESVPTGIIIASSDGCVRYSNRAALTYLSLPSLTHINKIRQLYPALASTIEGLKNHESRSVAIETEKEARELHVQRIDATLNERSIHIITLNDIHAPLDQRETDSWISLIRVMTHEIMNSIAPIRAIAEVMLDQASTLTPTATQAISTIYSTSNSLLRFVEDYRKFSAVPQPKLAEVAVNPLLEQASTRIAHAANAKGISISTAINNDIDTLNADEGLVLQVLHNLLKNAVEATPAGGSITISTIRTSTQRPRISVYNSGPPIEESIRPYIFIPFFSTKPNGSGIGLSLSRYIMRLHGGNLTYHALRHGSRFDLEF